MISLVIDIGNTLTKVALFNNRSITEVNIFETFNADTLEQFSRGRNISHAIVSSVDASINEIEAMLYEKYTYVRFSTSSASRIINNYKTPYTLGLDRYAAVIGAEALYPQQNVLVIDAGTCITYDLVDSERRYYGGSISPGISMRFRAVHTFTGRLPLIEPDAAFDAPYGDDTRTAILSGIQQGAYNEALGFIQSYASGYPDLQVLLCGGDVKFFDSRLKSSIFAHSVKTEPHLVLIGLNEVIYQYND